MTALAERSVDLELMDDLNCHGEVVEQTLRELDTINRRLGGNRVTLDGIAKLVATTESSRHLHVADIGCGSGEMAGLIMKWARRVGRSLTVTGIDANRHIVEFAERHRKYSGVSFKVSNVLEKEYADLKFDVVVATLFMHHFSRDQLILIFRTLNGQTRIGFVVNDIHRHPLALHAIRLLTVLFSRSSMVKYDAPLSVRRAFSRRDLEDVLANAGITTYSLKWRWAFRWQLIVKSNKG